MLAWKFIDSPESIDKLIEESFEKLVLIFKHSTTCSISHMAKMRIESDWNIENVELYFLDLKKYRHISDSIAEKFKVFHESPQVILLKNGESFYDASHFDITVDEIQESIRWISKGDYVGTIR